MSKISEEDLILYHYKELPIDELTAIKSELASNVALNETYQRLTRLLKMNEEWQPSPVDENFEQQMWQRVDAGIERLIIPSQSDAKESKTSLWYKLLQWFDSVVLRPIPVLSALIIMVSVAYLTGRHDEQTAMVADPTLLVASLSTEARNNILFQSVSSHLEKSSRLLTMVSIDSNDNTELLTSERNWAKNLLLSNRLFSKAAENAGQHRIVSLLDELEPLLIEMANSDKNSLSSREQIQTRINNQKLVFKTKAFKAKAFKTI